VNPKFTHPHEMMNDFHQKAKAHLRRWPQYSTSVAKIKKDFEEMIVSIEDYSRNQVAIFESEQTYLQLAA